MNSVLSENPGSIVGFTLLLMFFRVKILNDHTAGMKGFKVALRLFFVSVKKGKFISAFY